MFLQVTHGQELGLTCSYLPAPSACLAFDRPQKSGQYVSTLNKRMKGQLQRKENNIQHNDSRRKLQQKPDRSEGGVWDTGFYFYNNINVSQKFLQEKLLLLKVKAWSSPRHPFSPWRKQLFLEEERVLWGSTGSGGTAPPPLPAHNPGPLQSEPSRAWLAPAWSCFHPQSSGANSWQRFFNQGVVTQRSGWPQRILSHKQDNFLKKWDIFVYRVFILPDRKRQPRTMSAQCWTLGNPSREGQRSSRGPRAKSTRHTRRLLSDPFRLPGVW